jgi:hypothetical protein
MMKAILYGVLSVPIVVSAYAGLRYHYRMPYYVAIPVGVTFQVINAVGVMISMDESK